MNKTILNEVKTAYADANMGWEEGKNLRQLMFKASEAVDVQTAHAILKEAIPGGYNEFKASTVLLFPAQARIRIAREYSVCLYIYGVKSADMPPQESLMADEYDWVEDHGELVLRCWWD